jgi:phospholipase/carboxylesterase
VNAAPLETVEAGSGQADAVVVWLHGLGADGYDFYPIVGELGLPDDLAVRFVFPHAPRRPVTLNAGMVMRAWYDVADLTLAGRSHDAEGIEQSAAAVAALLEREEQRGVTSSRIVLAGFSQGGAMATFAGLRYPRRLAGLCALSCYALLPERFEAERHPANHDAPVFLAHGSDDPVVPPAGGRDLRQRLESAGHPVEWHEYPVPHGVHPQEIADVGRWLAARFAGSS